MASVGIQPSVQLIKHFHQVPFFQGSLEQRCIIICYPLVWFVFHSVIHSSFSEYSLAVHFCPWHCSRSLASQVLYSSPTIYRRDSFSPRSMPPALWQCSSSCSSPRNSITFLLTGSTFLTAHPLCRSRAPSSHMEHFH